MGKVTTDESVEKMLAAHEGEWIAFTATDEDEHGQPTRGELVAHSADRAEFFAELKAQSVREVWIRYAGELFPAGRNYIL